MKRYGASPVHLLAHLAALAVTALAVLQMVDLVNVRGVVIWFVASIVLHDLVLLPFYTVLDRVAKRPAGRAVVYLRVPAVLSGMVFLVYFPVILGKGSETFRALSNQQYENYATRWLVLTAVLFAGSLAIYLVKGRTSAARRRPAR